ncbi:MAG TPA: PH domain-containing protein [Lysobacter sp.]|nr:PH domain-containing protein [Lysobacter sp.]
MSWLFVLLAQLRQFVVPLIALFVFGRGDRNELWPLIGVGALAAVSVWQYFTYRYGVGADALVVRSGLFERSLRVIPFARIHNVAVQQSVLHRLFGVAEVRLESAGGTKPEAHMRVLRLDDALALETLVRRRAASTPAATGTTPANAAGFERQPAATTLLRLSATDLLRLGLVSNRGMILAGAALAAFSQSGPRVWPNLFDQVARYGTHWSGQHHLGTSQYVLGGVAVLVAVVALLRLLSIVLAVLQYHGFVLSQDGRRLTVERGLLARWRTSASRRRIQAWTLSEGLTHRLLGRRSLEVDTATGEENGQSRALRELAPIATPAACDALIERLLPDARWPELAWQPLPLGSWWRRFLPALPWTALATAALVWRFGGWGALALLWLPWAALKARAQARRAAYAVGAELLAVREGWWNRHWRFAEIDKLQALQLTRSPLDRRCATATLWLDTAGARSPPLRIRYLPEAEAQAIYRQLSQELAHRPLRW